MLRTSNYDLCQYQGSDKTSYLVNYNEDMLKIDTAIKGVSDAADAAQSAADSAASAAQSAEDNVTTLDTQINGTNGIAARVTDVEGDVNTIEALIGNGTPTTTDKTIIGAINELNSEIGSAVTAAGVTYDNQSSGLTATNVQSAIDEVVAAIPTAGDVELQHGTLEAGQTSLTLTFANVTIGANTLIDLYCPDGVAPSAKSTTSSTVVLTFAAQASDIVVFARATNA